MTQRTEGGLVNRCIFERDSGVPLEMRLGFRLKTRTTIPMNAGGFVSPILLVGYLLSGIRNTGLIAVPAEESFAAKLMSAKS